MNCGTYKGTPNLNVTELGPRQINWYLSLSLPLLSSSSHDLFVILLHFCPFYELMFSFDLFLVHPNFYFIALESLSQSIVFPLSIFLSILLLLLLPSSSSLTSHSIYSFILYDIISSTFPFSFSLISSIYSQAPFNVFAASKDLIFKWRRKATTALLT